MRYYNALGDTVVPRRGTHILFLRVLSCPIKKLNTKGAKEYSLLIEEDGDNFMFKIIHLDDGFKIGKIATFDGFEWFGLVLNGFGWFWVMLGGWVGSSSFFLLSIFFRNCF